MAVYEQSSLLRCKDDNGNEYLLYPITKLDCVDGAEDLVHYDKDQELTAVQKAQFLKNIGGLCAPVSAQTNQFLKVSAVDANGNVTAVETAVVEGGSSSDSLEQVQSDWNMSDATDPAYLKNKPFGEETIETVLVEEEELTFVYDSEFGVYMSVPTSNIYPIENGKEYVIISDGNRYVRTAAPSPIVYDLPAVGNALLHGGIDDGCPVSIIYNPENSFFCYIALSEASQTISVYTDSTVIKQIDPKYLPDNIGGGSSLPEVTIEDVGKFLRVSDNGIWAAEVISNAEEATF